MIASSENNMACMIELKAGVKLAFRDNVIGIFIQTDGYLVLSLSSLTYRHWSGSLWCYKSADTAPSIEQSDAGVELESGVSEVAWLPAPYTKRIIVAADSGAVMVWEMGEEGFMNCLAQPLEHHNMVSSVDVNSNGLTAVSGSHDNRVKVWDMEEVVSTHTYRAHAGAVTCVRCQPSDSNVFVSCAQDGRVLLWDTRKCKPASVLDTSTFKSNVTSIAWQPQESGIVAMGTETGSLGLFDIRSNSLASSPLSVHSRAITKITFAHHKKWLASGSEDSTAAVTDFSSSPSSPPLIIYREEGHADFVQGVAWHPTDNRLFTASWDGTVKARQVCSPEAIASVLSTTKLDSEGLDVDMDCDPNDK